MLLNRALVLIALLCLSGWARGAAFEVLVTDADGVPLPDAAVYLQPTGDARDGPMPTAQAMDQVNKQFAPHMLVVQQGAEVRFPNSDSIKHHVYSFSSTKTFELKLYSQQSETPVLFDRTGVVELGCNIHDWMLGYIYVVDTPYFAKSSSDGSALIEAPMGEYTISVWHPRMQDDPQDLALVSHPDVLTYQLTLKKPLLPEYQADSAVDFDDYE
jgi:plastocyanin